MSVTSPATSGSTTPPVLVDEDLLAQIGLGDADPQTREEFAALMHRELEERVGAALSEGLSDDQLAVFEAFIDRDMATTRAWLAAHCPDYEHSARYRRMVAHRYRRMIADTTVRADAADEAGLVCEFAAYAWLDTYRPDYPQVVARLAAQLRAETIAILTTH